MPNSLGNMGINFASQIIFKRNCRFILDIWGITTGNIVGSGTEVGNPAVQINEANIGTTLRDGLSVYIWEKASRPSFSFKETEVNHLSETIYYPGRADWKPLKVTLYDTMHKTNPVVEWISFVYGMTNNARNFKTGVYYGGLEFASQADPARKFKRNVTVTALDGQGDALEQWFYYNAWPQEVDFGEYDMTSSDIMRINMTLRYDRAEWKSCTGS